MVCAGEYDEWIVGVQQKAVSVKEKYNVTESEPYIIYSDTNEFDGLVISDIWKDLKTIVW